jgi:hypothetical protein
MGRLVAWLGRLYQRSGARRTTEEHRDKADRMYRDLGMRFWLEQARTQSDNCALSAFSHPNQGDPGTIHTVGTWEDR